MTSRGLKEADFVQIGELLHKCVRLALKVQNIVLSKTKAKLLKDFEQEIANNPEIAVEVTALTQEVHDFSKTFGYPSV